MPTLHHLTPAEHARLYALARQAAHEARGRAMAEFWRALGRPWGLTWFGDGRWWHRHVNQVRGTS